MSGGTSIYGPLSTPIVLLIFLYALAIAVLIGAALNAAIRGMWPVEDRLSLRAQVVDWVKARVARAQGGLAARQRAGSTAMPPASAGRVDELTSSVKALRDEARKPLTPMPRGSGTDTDDTQFGDDADDRIMSARTRSG